MQYQARLITTYILGCFTACLFSFGKPSELSFYPKGFSILERDSYTVCYDGRNRIPLWVYQKISANSPNIPISRDNGRFREDESVYLLHRSRLKDYESSGYDRGHMCPARDGIESENALQETFYLSNICPQDPYLNREVWKALEHYVRTLSSQYQTLHVYTGPLFIPKMDSFNKTYVYYQTLGSSHVAVPTHFFKIIIGKRGEKSVEKAFLIPNAPVGMKEDRESFKVSIETVEKVSGLNFLHLLQK